MSWPKARHEIRSTNGVVESVTEQEIADAKAQIGAAGIGCEPASAATLAGIRKLRGAGIIASDADVVAVLTGNVLKDPDYIFKYHTGVLKAPDSSPITVDIRQRSRRGPERPRPNSRNVVSRLTIQ